MSKTAMIRARTEPKLKNEVERIFHSLGISFTEAINLFFHQVKLWKGIPFDIRVPNKTTLEAVDQINQCHDIIGNKDIKEMFKKLGI